jgi:hypothetical protein
MPTGNSKDILDIIAIYILSKTWTRRKKSDQKSKQEETGVSWSSSYGPLNSLLSEQLSNPEYYAKGVLNWLKGYRDLLWAVHRSQWMVLYLPQYFEYTGWSKTLRSRQDRYRFLAGRHRNWSLRMMQRSYIQLYPHWVPNRASRSSPQW